MPMPGCSPGRADAAALLSGMADGFVALVAALLRGLAAHAVGLKLLLRRPTLLMRCLSSMLLTQACTVAAATALWSAGLPLRLVSTRFSFISYDAVLRVVSLVVLNVASALLPHLSSRAFFAALHAVDPREAAALQQRPVVNGLAAQLRGLVLTVLGAVGTLGALGLLLALTLSIWWPPFASGALAVSMAMATPLGVGVLGGTALLGGFLLVLLAPSLRLYLRWKPLSLTVSAALALASLLRLLPARAMALAGEVAAGGMLSLLTAQQLLAPCSARQPRAEWRHHCAVHQWALVGFGAPVGFARVLRELHPLGGLVLLELSHAAAAALVADLRLGRSCETR